MKNIGQLPNKQTMRKIRDAVNIMRCDGDWAGQLISHELEINCMIRKVEEGYDVEGRCGNKKFHFKFQLTSFPESFVIGLIYTQDLPQHWQN